MNSKNILGYAFFHAVLAVLYVAGIAAIMLNLEHAFGPEKGILTPVVFLLLFVTSAAVMGMLLFVRPMVWYLEGLKKEAIQLAVSTVAFLVLFITGVIIALLSGVI